ncbi:ankyrin repeat protein [Russula ochroleuca]|uniref:Ankyrin repeat protein n=1 Tax=Russula ochroleuca TaxID=152965 RepID=A0A9P5MZB2_9AGAM|nr:ankyrin repeat protein [Russula ochroleuca]
MTGRLLLEHGALVNAQSRSHKTPLYRASEYGRLEAVEVLLGHGADLHIQRKYQNPLQVARSKGHVEVVQLLLMHGAES